MIRRLLASSFVLGLTLYAAVLGAPLFDATQLPGGLNPNAPPPGPQEKVTKEVVQLAGRAFCLAISSDGTTLATGCTDHTVRLIDAATGEEKRALTGIPRGYARGVAFTPDGNTIVGIGDDDEVRLWDAATGKQRGAFPALGDLEPDGLPPTWPHALAISPDGGRIAVGGSGTVDRSGVIRLDENSFFVIRVLDARTGARVWSQVGRRGFLHQLAFSPDGRMLASDSLGDVKVWDARTGQPKQTLKPRAGSIWSLAFSPDSRLVAGYGMAVIEEKRGDWLTLWDVRSGTIVRAIEASEAGAVAAPGTLAFSPDGKSVASAGVGIAAGRISIGGGPVAFGQKVINFVKLWDIATGEN